MFDQLMQTLIIITALVMGLMGVGIMVYVQRSLRPLRRMNRMAANIPDSELAHYQFELNHASGKPVFLLLQNRITADEIVFRCLHRKA